MGTHLRRNMVPFWIGKRDPFVLGHRAWPIQPNVQWLLCIAILLGLALTCPDMIWKRALQQFSSFCFLPATGFRNVSLDKPLSSLSAPSPQQDRALFYLCPTNAVELQLPTSWQPGPLQVCWCQKLSTDAGLSFKVPGTLLIGARKYSTLLIRKGTRRVLLTCKFGWSWWVIYSHYPVSFSQIAGSLDFLLPTNIWPCVSP